MCGNMHTLGLTIRKLLFTCYLICLIAFGPITTFHEKQNHFTKTISYENHNIIEN